MASTLDESVDMETPMDGRPHESEERVTALECAAVCAVEEELVKTSTESGTALLSQLKARRKATNSEFACRYSSAEGSLSDAITAVSRDWSVMSAPHKHLEGEKTFLCKKFR